MNSYRFYIWNRRENKFCSHDVLLFRLISKWPSMLMGIRTHFISGSVYMIFSPEMKFHFCQNECDEITLARIFKRTCLLSTISNESALIHFVSGKFFPDENLMPAWNFISVKMTDMKSKPGSFHFPSIHVNTSKEQTEHWSKIFHRNEISNRFEFISAIMWTYLYFKLYVINELITFSSCAMF